MPLHACDPQPVERPFQAAHWEQGKKRSVDCRSGYLVQHVSESTKAATTQASDPWHKIQTTLIVLSYFSGHSLIR